MYLRVLHVSIPLRLRACTLSALIFACPLAAYSVTDTAPDNLLRASELVRAKQYDAAISITRRLVLKDPRNARALTVEAIAYSSKGDDQHALRDLRQALKVMPELQQALQVEASILFRRHDPALIPVLKQILQGNSHDLTALEMMAVTDAQADNCSAALAAFDELGTSIATHPASLQLKAACLMRKKAFREAIPVLQAVLALQPQSGDTRYDLAVAQYEAGDTKASAETLTPLLQQAADIDTLTLAADVYEAEGDTPRSVSLLRSAILADPQRSNSYIRFAELCMSHESYEAGIDMITAGLKRAPTADPALYLARGLLYGGLARYDEAEADFLTAERLDPQHGTGAYAVGVINMQRNRPEQALDDVRKGLLLHPKDAQLHFLLARVLLESGARTGSPEFAEAQHSAEVAVSLAPDLVLARNLLAKIYQESGRSADAVVQCRAVLAIDPNDGQALYRLMRSLRETGQMQEAQEVGRRVSSQRNQERNNETDRLRFKIQTSAPPAQP